MERVDRKPAIGIVLAEIEFSRASFKSDIILGASINSRF